MIADGYLWWKALHVISIIAWMAALLYLPRLYVYHVDAEPGSTLSETLKVMERRLLRAIMTPAMVASYVFGGLLLASGAVDLSGGWLHAKLALVVLLTVMHGAMARWRRAFAEDRNQRSTRFFRMMNEVPTLLMIGIVILVIVKPF
ncbi:MAG: TIGR00701 family protein [Rhodospirillaceae bacterium]|nr:TIGR00701 family protein [Rhodospirillaceae bacterium]|tara:strand:- start:1966 stop:2403 length:438 start_codon:yes stop_codon:yes gene_type:complete